MPFGTILHDAGLPGLLRRGDRHRAVAPPHTLHLAGGELLGRIQGLPRPGAHRRGAARFELLDRRRGLLRPAAQGLAPRFPGFRHRGRGCRLGLLGHGAQPAPGRRHGALGRSFGAGASRHPADALRPHGSHAADFGACRRQTRARGARAIPPAGGARGARTRGPDRRPGLLPGAALVVRHAPESLHTGRRCCLHHEDVAVAPGPARRDGPGAQPGAAPRAPAGARGAGGQRLLLGTRRRHARERDRRRQCRGRRFAARTQRLPLRLAALRRTAPQPGIRRPHLGTRREPRFRLLRHGRPERLGAALRLYDGPAPCRSCAPERQPPRFGLAALGACRRQGRGPVARRPERPDPGLRRPLPLQRQADRRLGDGRPRREFRLEQARRAALGLRRRDVPLEDQLPHDFRIPAPECLALPSDPGRRAPGSDSRGPQAGCSQRLFAAFGAG